MVSLSRAIPAIASAGPTVAAEIEAALLTDLRQRAPQGRNEAIALSLTTNDGTLVGGLSGSTSYGWLLIKVLWVAPGVRRQGYGRALVSDAFGRGEALGCHSVWLDTSDEDAKAFYLQLGFEVFASLANHAEQTPQGHQRWFLKCLIP